jgi:hypothetical protein
VNLSEDLGHAAAVIVIFSDLLSRKFITGGHIGRMLRGFLPIFSWSPATIVASGLHLHVSSGFMRISCLTAADQAGCPIHQFLGEFMSSILSVVTYPAAPDAVRASFTDLLLWFANARWSKLRVNQEMIYGLLEASTAPMFRVAGILTSALPHQYQFIVQLFRRFTETLQGSPLNETVHMILGFIANYHVEDQAATRAVVLDFLHHFNGVRDDELLTQVILGVKQLDVMGFDYFSELALIADGPKAICAVVDCTRQLRYLTVASLRNPAFLPYQVPEPWLHILIESQILRYFAETVNTLKVSQKSSDFECGLLRRFIALFIELAGIMNDDTAAWLLEGGKELLMRRYDVASFWDSILQLAERFVDARAEIVIEQFVPISFRFVFAHNFDPARTEWYLVVFRTLRLHNRVYGAKRKYQEFTQAIMLNLLKLGLDQDEAERYLHTIEKDLREANAELTRFAFLLMMAKNARVW